MKSAGRCCVVTCCEVCRRKRKFEEEIRIEEGSAQTHEALARDSEVRV